jgi:uncharacterized surface anchored protein
MFDRQIPIRALFLASFLSLLELSAAAQTAAPPAPPPVPTPSLYKIAGTVVSKTDGHALARARVTVTDSKDSHKFQTRVTGDDGKYEFTGLPAGKYSLNGAKKGFISAGYDQHDQYWTAIVTGAGLDTEHLPLRLTPDAIVSGKVLDESGEPVRHATVMFFYQDHSSGVDRIRQSRSAQTDDLGEYEMTPLRPGAYFVSASAQPWYAVHPSSRPNRFTRTQDGDQLTDVPAEPPTSVDPSLDVTYPVTYYPDVPNPDEAMPIPIQGGEHVAADIHLTPVPSLRMVVRVPEDAQGHVGFPQFVQPAFDGVTYLHTNGYQQISPGVFEVNGIPAGRYDIRFLGGGTNQQMNAVDLTKNGEEIDGTKAGAVSNVKFSVQLSGQALPSHLNVGLRSNDRMLVALGEIDSKGEVELHNVPAGHYEISVWGASTRYFISHLSAEGASVSGHALNIAAASNSSASLTLITGNADVSGKVTHAGKGLAGAMVVLVPNDPELDSDLFRRDQSDLDGTFTLRGVVAGSYTLLAIEKGWDLDWSQPGVIGVYAKHGRKIQVGAENGHPTNVADPIEVQSK